MSPTPLRPDFVHCIKHVRKSEELKRDVTWCERVPEHKEWLFQDVDHAALNAQQGGRMVACPSCCIAVTAVLERQQEIYAECVELGEDE